jgi:hypothetical protein
MVRLNEYREAIKHLEMARIQLYKHLVQEMYSQGQPDIHFSDRLPKCLVKRHEINGYPVYQLSYAGILPMYDDDPGYHREIRDYYIRATLRGYDWRTNTESFEKAAIMAVHYFSDLSIRDLDNRNRSVLINAIRYTGLIGDDNWKNITYLEKGEMDYKGRCHVQMYVLDSENLSDFLLVHERIHYEIVKELKWDL